MKNRRRRIDRHPADAIGIEFGNHVILVVSLTETNVADLWNGASRAGMLWVFAGSSFALARSPIHNGFEGVVMSTKKTRTNTSGSTGLHRRQFLKTATAASVTVAAPTIIPSSALGRDGHVAPSERIVMGGIGIGRRGGYDLSCFLPQKDVQFVAVCDVKQKRRREVKGIVDKHYGNQHCDTYRDFRELLDRDDIDAVLIATGPNWHSTAAMTAARAGKDMYCEKPVTKNIAQSLILADTMRRTGRVFQAGTQRRNLPHFAFACELARSGKLGKLTRVYAHPMGMKAIMSGWLAPEPEPDKGVVDWDMYLGPAAWRPYNEKLLDGFNFEKGGGFVGAFSGGGVLEWGSHCVDLCQWAVDDCPPPVEYNPPADGQMKAPTPTAPS